jgi:hypothetical protein
MDIGLVEQHLRVPVPHRQYVFTVPRREACDAYRTGVPLPE